MSQAAILIACRAMGQDTVADSTLVVFAWMVHSKLCTAVDYIEVKEARLQSSIDPSKIILGTAHVLGNLGVVDIEEIGANAFKPQHHQTLRPSGREH